MKLPVGIVQGTPAVLDLQASVDRTCGWIAEAGRRGLRLLAFPETWISGYPFWCDAGRFSRWGDEDAKRVQAALLRESLVVPSPELDRIRSACRDAAVAVVLGANERGRGGTAYNALLFVDERGELRGHRRKLVPTFGERLVWGYGDAHGLEPHLLAGARVGGLICWEHWMPLPRHVLHAGGEQVHVASWPHGKEAHQLASRHYAFEGRCFVLAAAAVLRRSHLPDGFPLLDDTPDEILPGGSAIVAPDGAYVVEPVFSREELIAAELDLDRTLAESITLDVGGHYSRPDLFDLRVRRDRLEPFRDA